MSDRTHILADAILMAANLGEDADTTAAVCGQVAGGFYGASTIPSHWLERLAFRAKMTQLADQLSLHTLQIPKSHGGAAAEQYNPATETPSM